MQLLIKCCAVCIAIHWASVGFGALTFNQVKTLATTAITEHQFEYELVKIGQEPNSRQVWWQAGNFWLPPRTPIDYVIFVQTQIERMRASYRSPTNPTGISPRWELLVAQSESVVRSQMLPVANDARLSDPEKFSAIRRLHALERQRYSQALRDWATRNDWQYVVKTLTKGAYRVRIISDPPRANIKIRPAVYFLADVEDGKNPVDWMTDINSGHIHTWSREEFIMAIFTNGLVFGPAKRLVTQHGTLTISPDGTDLK